MRVSKQKNEGVPLALVAAALTLLLTVLALGA
jgi:hypothetical protein